jgi:hypothetical protein
MNRWMFVGLLIVVVSSGCGDDGGGAGGTPAADAGGDSSDEDAPANCPLECSGHGDCVINGGLPDCVCHDGYEPQGLDCIDPNANAEPPADFTCPAPGDTSGAEGTRLVSQGWAYWANDRSCEPGATDLYHFGANGVFTRHHQASSAGRGGTLIYGCWSMVSEVDGLLSMNFDHADDNPWQYNCGVIAESADPPCSGLLKHDAARGGFVAQIQLEYGEVHVLYPVPDGCVWCNDRADCCPNPSWVEADGALLCE